ncbi:Carbohydrate binding module (family 6) [Jatrophihabitans endophyticus]|uniref:Carbohydrate binding module (Family 6) n=1 Tax=Jatrophihabitans endophyticus TaxID=1206085 RepID=A0A1M5HS64_9ACTN|nr:Carbohydrate binding module (family 6) [Jatrophihabitans endophyticus]
MALLGVTAVVAATLNVGSTAAQADPTPTPTTTYTSGHARFEVLSPTLIRTEYSADGTFTDDATFNAIGRGGFAPTTSTGEEKDGWFVVTTPKATLKYEIGSGKFTESNLVLSEDAGTEPITAAPWAGKNAPTCDVGSRCEAEGLLLTGNAVQTNHKDYTGTGFVGGFEATNASVSFTATVASEGDYDIATRYANSQGGDGKNETRTLSVSADGGASVALSLPQTANWDTWSTVRTSLHLTAGEHVIRIVRSATDSGDVNMDNVAVLGKDVTYPDPVAAGATPCAFGTVCEAEKGTLAGGATPATDHNGYSGSSFVAGLDTNASDTLHLTGVPADGSYVLQLRYAKGSSGSRPVSIEVGAADATSASLPSTGGWDEWRTVDVPVTLTAGANDVAIQCPTADSCGVNVDTVAFTATGAPTLTPHVPLGGYRRSIDDVGSATITNPGLLYRDGWYLLDDTASALYDATTRTVTQRPSHDGKAYQDGYVFAYGHDYQQGLQDLSTLTGPAKLLPRWAYGTWYSEYYDRTSADFESIVKRFRSEGVPLDTLVVDTDFKTPNQWNGWEIDPAKFPDPKAFFAWAHAQGLRTSLNLHPSIEKSDPQFDKAQEIAKGKLQPGSCGGGAKDCYVFDFGDADQLKAYLALHDDMQAAGNDLWWMDWCCDGSTMSLPGVTGDAWVNQAYADYTAKTVDRGFAFSRAYGTLEAGGYGNITPTATGPWADKRTTLHFTGDTTSNWNTLAYEVGYTPGESVATGMPSISHDIGGHTGGLQEPGSEKNSTKLPDDLYARWVQFGTFQPIDRLHSNHSDRLPWQYGTAANASANKFLNLRENLVPYTYTLAQQARATGAPITRPLYLQYPDAAEAYDNAAGEYLYGPDVLVAPVTKAGEGSVDTQVWFPPGNSWTDWFTGKTYAGGTTQTVTTGLDTMPVFVKSGGIVTTRTNNVANDQQNPLDQVTVSAAEGADGSYSLYEDDGTTTDSTQSATTAIDYSEKADRHTLAIAAAKGSYTGQVAQRSWTAKFTNAAKKPATVSVDGVALATKAWSYDAATRTVTVSLPARPTSKATTVSYTTNAAPTAAAVVARTAVGVPVTIRLAGADSDRDRLTYTHSSPKHGTVTGSGATLRYTSARTFVGTDRFSYTVTDPSGSKATNTVTVKVGRQQPTLSVKAKVRSGRSAVLTARVHLRGGVSAGSAAVTATQGKKVLARGHLRKGVVTLTLRKLARGKHAVVVAVAAGKVTSAARQKVTFRIR